MCHYLWQQLLQAPTGLQQAAINSAAWHVSSVWAWAAAARGGGGDLMFSGPTLLEAE